MNRILTNCRIQKKKTLLCLGSVTETRLMDDFRIRKDNFNRKKYYLFGHKSIGFDDLIIHVIFKHNSRTKIRSVVARSRVVAVSCIRLFSQ